MILQHLPVLPLLIPLLGGILLLLPPLAYADIAQRLGGRWWP